MYSVSPPASAQPEDPLAEADRLFYEGSDLVRTGKVADGCEKLARSVALLRRSGTLYNLAACREELGEPLTALGLLQEALQLALRTGRTERVDSIRQHIAALRDKLAWITLVFDAGTGQASGEVEIRVNGLVVPPEDRAAPVPVTPGTYVVTATAAGKKPFEIRADSVRAGESHEVRIPVLQDLSPVRPAAPAAKPAVSSPDAAAPPPSLSHAWQLGAVARLDIYPGPGVPGARLALGLTFGLGDHFEVGASALIGPESGVEPRVTFHLFGQNAFKPLLDVGVPVFVSKDARAGIRGSAGLLWDYNRHLGFFGTVGAAYFPDPPVDHVDVVFLPAVGVQGRL